MSATMANRFDTIAIGYREYRNNQLEACRAST
jgi:hypothetical protein